MSNMDYEKDDRHMPDKPEVQKRVQGITDLGKHEAHIIYDWGKDEYQATIRIGKKLYLFRKVK